MSRTKHARMHAHLWELDHKITYYRSGERVTKVVYRCRHAGCFAAKVVNS